jgi:hypothetical protein
VFGKVTDRPTDLRDCVHDSFTDKKSYCFLISNQIVLQVLLFHFDSHLEYWWRNDKRLARPVRLHFLPAPESQRGRESLSHLGWVAHGVVLL